MKHCYSQITFYTKYIDRDINLDSLIIQRYLFLIIDSTENNRLYLV